MEDYKIKYNHLVDKVKKMRLCQKEYFKHRSSIYLEAAKKLEREVDQLLNSEVDKTQQKLFDA